MLTTNQTTNIFAACNRTPILFLYFLGIQSVEEEEARGNFGSIEESSLSLLTH